MRKPSQKTLMIEEAARRAANGASLYATLCSLLGRELTNADASFYARAQERLRRLRKPRRETRAATEAN